MSTTSSTESNNTINTTATSAAPIKINSEQAVAFAALILADDNLAITPEKLQTLLKAAGITEVEPIWTTLFANALKDKDVKDILVAVNTSGPKAGGETGEISFNNHDDDLEVDGDDVDYDEDSEDYEYSGGFLLFD